MKAPLTAAVVLLLSASAPAQVNRETITGPLRDALQQREQAMTDAAVRAKPVTIASWNIEWLGTPAGRSHQGQGKAQDIDALARVIAASGADLVALQEIRPDPDVDDDPELESAIVAAVLDRLERGGRGSWDHVLFPAHRASGNQLTGLAWNTDVLRRVGQPRQVHAEARAGGDPTQPQEGLWTAGPRPAFGLQFSAGDGMTDFVVIPVHWKSGGDADDVKQRRDEAAEIVAGLPKVFRDPDVVILGDTNAATADEPALAVLRDAGFRDLNERDQPTVPFGNLALDRALVPRDQPEFRDTQLRVVQQGRPDTFREQLSDHYPIVLTLRAGPDDD